MTFYGTRDFGTAGNERMREMSDSAFKTAMYPAYTTAELLASVERKKADGYAPMDYAGMVAEIKRRELVAAGDVSVMTAGERLRHAKAS
jgi:hypothetical protein